VNIEAYARRNSNLYPRLRNANARIRTARKYTLLFIASAGIFPLSLRANEPTSYHLSWQSKSPRNTDRRICLGLQSYIQSLPGSTQRSLLFEQGVTDKIRQPKWSPTDLLANRNALKNLFQSTPESSKQPNLAYSTNKRPSEADDIISRLIQSRSISIERADAPSHGKSVVLFRVRWVGWTGGSLSEPASGTSTTERSTAIIIHNNGIDGKSVDSPIFPNLYASLGVLIDSTNFWIVDASRLQIRQIDFSTGSKVPIDNPICTVASLGEKK
jgi:hypothetical protein